MDRRARAQQRLVDRLLFLQGDTLRRQGEQGGSAARDEAQHEVVGSQALDAFEQAAGAVAACGIGHRVARLDDRR